MLASNLLNGNLIGDYFPTATVISWVALLCLVLAAVLHPAVRERLTRQPWLVSLATVAVLVVLGEGLARAWALAEPETEGFPTYRADIWAGRFVRTNALGFRDRDHDPSLKEHRLLVIGDSYAFGVGIKSPADRLGERLAGALDTATGSAWESYNGGVPDRNTLEETQVLRQLLPTHPDVVVLLYVFNDMDYLVPITPRPAFLEAPTGILARIRPTRLLFLNSFLYQELFVRWRHIRVAFSKGGDEHDPYSDSTLVARHLEDVCAFVRLAASRGAVVGVVPFDVATQLSAFFRRRMATFTREAERAGIPVWSIDSAFAGHSYASLVVNSLDGHPSALANHLAAGALLRRLLPLVSGTVPIQKPACRSTGS